MMISIGRRSAALALRCLALLILFATPARAQHSDWLLGTDGLLSGQQAPRGIYYSNIWSYYHGSRDGVGLFPRRRPALPRGRVAREPILPRATSRAARRRNVQARRR